MQTGEETTKCNLAVYVKNVLRSGDMTNGRVVTWEIQGTSFDSQLHNTHTRMGS